MNNNSSSTFMALATSIILSAAALSCGLFAQDKVPPEKATANDSSADELKQAELYSDLKDAPDGVLRVTTNSDGSFKSLLVKSTVKTEDGSGGKKANPLHEAEPQCKTTLGKWLQDNCVFLEAPDNTVTIKSKGVASKDAAGNTVNIGSQPGQEFKEKTIALWKATAGLKIASKGLTNENREFVLIMYLTQKTLSEATVDKHGSGKPGEK